jgi:hypothetical protein
MHASQWISLHCASAEGVTSGGWIVAGCGLGMFAALAMYSAALQQIDLVL